MKLSTRQLDANRRNAQKSTGPRTAEGKAVSRANALIHGLCSSVVIAEDPKTVGARAREFFDTLRPQNDFHCFLVGEIALLTIRIERSERIDYRVRDKIAIRAELSWDDDRRLEAELLGEQLGNRPAVVVEQLRRTPQGCEWLIGRWAMLAYVADGGRWTPEQEQLAFDLMATPALFRVGRQPGVELDAQGKVVDEGDQQAAVARREIAGLTDRMSEVNGIDQANRALAMADLYDDHDAELKRVRKQEGALHSRLRWCRRQLQEQAPDREVPPWLKVKWLGSQVEANAPAILPPPVPLPEPTPVQEPPPDWAGKKAWVDAIHAPFELEPDEIPPVGERPDYVKILANRQIKMMKTTDDRREAKRRDVKKLFA